MEDIGLQWNPRKCAVVHIRRGVHFQQNFGRDIVGDRVPTLEEGRQYKFLGVLESIVQEEKMVLELAAKEYLIIPSYRVKEVLKECVEEKLEREVRGLEWQGKLLIERKSDSHRREGASLLLSPIRPLPTHHYQCDVT